MTNMREQLWIHDHTGKSTDKTKKGLAEKLGIDPAGVTAIIDGRRKIQVNEIKIIADYFNLPMDTIFYYVTGEHSGMFEPEQAAFQHKADIPVVGRAGAGEVHFPIDDYAMGDGMYHTERPPGLTGPTVALEVRGDSMEPVFDEDDLIFYQRNQGGVPAECHNKKCVVQVKDGPVYLKILKPAIARGYFHLHSINSKNEVIPDQQIEWASKVLFVKKG